MIVRYDDFNRLQTPELTLCNPSCYAYKNKEGHILLKNCIGRIPYVSDFIVTLNFNAPSELSFSTTCPVDNSNPPFDLVRQINPKRYIYASELGFFLIESVTRSREKKLWTYSVSARSCEAELTQWMLPMITEGVMRLYIPENEPSGEAETPQGIINLLLDHMPYWSIGKVDACLIYGNTYYKTSPICRNLIDINDVSIYDFLMDTVQDAFQCLIIYDPIQRRIDLRDPNIYRDETNTNIRLDKKCLENSITIENNSNEQCTALYVSGGDNIGISAVNPMGTKTIYDFKPFYEWMSPALRTAVEKWEKKYTYLEKDQARIMEDYYKSMIEYYDAQFHIDVISSNLDVYNSLLKQLKTLQNLDNTEVPDNKNKETILHGAIEAANSKLSNALPEYSEITEYIDFLNTTIQGYEKDLVSSQCPVPEMGDELKVRQREVQLSTTATDLQGYSIFSKSLLQELSHFIYEGEYKDDYAAFTDSMTYSQRIKEYTGMMKRAREYLKTACKPSVKFDVDVASFLFSKHFERHATQLQTGCSISVETDDRVFETLYLTAFDVNYTDKSLHLTFGNAYEKFDMQSVFNNVFPKKMFSAT